MNIFKEKEMNAFGAYETTVFLRADLFILIEELLTRTYFVNFLIFKMIEPS